MPSSPSSSFPTTSSTRDSPNQHPYAIKTSSSAVLTRSNSTGNPYTTAHHYAPPSPAKNALAAKQSRFIQAHRHSRSLSNADAPPPMPVPPSGGAPVPARLANQLYVNGGEAVVSDGEGIPPTPPMTWRLKRSETLPSVFPNKSDTETTAQDLPTNPKVWSPIQLSVYLSSSLRLKGGAKLPVPIARDIAAFVLKEHLGGRAFLRMKKEDYDGLGINQLWKDALLDASRALRQNLVQGRIMGFGGPLSPRSAAEILNEADAGQDGDEDATLPAYSPHPQWEHDRQRMSKTSFRAGRVRGMVATYERSVSGSSDDDAEAVDFEVDGASVELVRAPDADDDAAFASGELTSGSEDGGVPVPVASPEVEASPSIEALLAQEPQPQSQPPRKAYPSWGARAWEDAADDDVHATARRIPAETIPQLTQLFAPPPHEQDVPPESEEPAVPKSSTADTARALDAFQRRLEAVEQRLDAMERADAARDKTQAGAVANIERRLTRDRPRAFDLFYPADPDPAPAKNYAGADLDPGVSGLPRYVFLVSLGVVAIVTRVVLRRVVGGRKRA